MGAGKILMIVNPVSGAGKLGDAVSRVGDALRDAGFEVSTRDTQAAGDASRIAREADADIRCVIAVGGDGTVREVVAGLLGRSIPIVVIPAGTENLVAHHFRMDPDPVHVVETVMSGRLQPCDVGLVNGRHFLIMAGMGFDAEVVARLTAWRTGHITHWRYLRPIWRTLLDHSFPTVVVEVEGRVAFEGRGLVFVGVMPCYAVGLNIVRDAVLDDGLLDVCVLPCASRTRLLLHAIRASRGAHVGRGGSIYIGGKHLRVTSPDCVPMQCDGDSAGELPAEFSVLEHGASFLTLRESK